MDTNIIVIQYKFDIMKLKNRIRFILIHVLYKLTMVLKDPF